MTSWTTEIVARLGSTSMLAPIAAAAFAVAAMSVETS